MNKRRLHILPFQVGFFLKILLLGFLLSCFFRLEAQEIDCDNTIYIATHISTGTSLYRFQVDANEGISNLEEVFSNNTEYHFGCIGYSVVDKMIYGLEFNTYEILRINVFGEITNLGIPKGLDTTLLYSSGAIFPGGRDLFVIGKDKNRNKDVAFYSIDVFDLRATPLAVVSDGDVTIQDMARNPIDGAVYGYDSQQKKIITVEIGQVNTYQFPSIPEQFTSLFFDTEGNLYGLGENVANTSRKFYAIDKIAGLPTFLEDGPMGNDSDACSCPYNFQFFKKVSPKRVFPCQEVTIEYSFLNTSGSARTNLRIYDELPSSMTITSIEFQSGSNDFNTKIISGIGTNIVDITRVEALLGDKNKITVKATVDPSFLGLISTQAVLENLPLALNPAMRSDNIETVTLEDANFIEVLDQATAEFEDNIEYDCEKKTATIFAPFPSAKSFLWHNGEITPSIKVEEAGTYTVEMETDCAIYTDEISVNFEQEPDFIDLGPDRKEKLGETFTLPFQTNFTDILEYNWSNKAMADFSCLDCPNPIITLLNPTSISLQLVDSRGCVVEDEIQIALNTNKSIYAATAFSPNGDGVNDGFFLQGTNAEISNFKIFDRWGNQVFEHQNGQVNDMDHVWDGNYKGEQLSSGVFIWFAQLVYADNDMENISGTVTLIR